MCSPLSSVLGNIFIGFYEFKWFNEYDLKKPKLYLTFVDGNLAAFNNEQDSLVFN